MLALLRNSWDDKEKVFCFFLCFLLAGLKQKWVLFKGLGFGVCFKRFWMRPQSLENVLNVSRCDQIVGVLQESFTGSEMF